MAKNEEMKVEHTRGGTTTKDTTDLGVRHDSDGANLSLKGRNVRRVRPMVEVAGMARDALRAHLRGGYIDLERPY